MLAVTQPEPTGLAPLARRRLIGYGVCLAVVAVCYALPLIDWLRFALKSSLYSHLVLMPFVSGYLIWVKRYQIIAALAEPTRWVCVPVTLGAACLVLYWWSRHAGLTWLRQDYLALLAVSAVWFAIGGFLWYLGLRAAKVAAFPLALAFLAAPFPRAIEDAIEVFFQHASAEAADLMLSVSGMPVLRDGVDFQLPGFRLTVAQECSGIHSTLVLFIVSLIAGHLFLRSPWRRVAFTAAVVPLAIVRNGFRIFTIAQLCVRVSPDMVHSYIHRQGGPIFFALFLVPFFALLVVMRTRESKTTDHGPRTTDHQPG